MRALQTLAFDPNNLTLHEEVPVAQGAQVAPRINTDDTRVDPRGTRVNSSGTDVEFNRNLVAPGSALVAPWQNEKAVVS